MNDLQEMIVQGVKDLGAAEVKLAIVTGKPGSGKSKVLRELADTQRWHYLDCKDLVTVADLKDVSEADKTDKAVEIMKNIFDNYREPVQLLDKMQSLFSPALGLDMMQVMKKAAVNKPLVVAWPGYYENDHLNFKNEMTGAVTSYCVADVMLFQLG